MIAVVVLAIKSLLQFDLTNGEEVGILSELPLKLLSGKMCGMDVLLDAKRMFCGVGYKEPVGILV